MDILFVLFDDLEGLYEPGLCFFKEVSIFGVIGD